MRGLAKSLHMNLHDLLYPTIYTALYCVIISQWTHAAFQGFEYYYKFQSLSTQPLSKQHVPDPQLYNTVL